MSDAGVRLAGKRVLLIVGGGIAAYKALELVRLLRRADCAVTCVLTEGGAHFVTPLSLQALSEQTVFRDLWSLTDESTMGHIQLSRSADLVVVAPASADILARMAAGLADDLAATLLLATDKRVLVAPAMNVRMWEHPATVANLETLHARGVAVVGPDEGPMACGEYGFGRLAEPPAILAAIEAMLGDGRLAGKHALVTAGPTHEPVDPVRFLGNRSSGKQGFAVAQALAELGARVTLVSGPTNLPDPPGVSVRRVETALQMFDACRAALPADVAVCAAAVADWRVADPAQSKLKKGAQETAPHLTLVENPDILASLSAAGPMRPKLVVGFAAETDAVVDNAVVKRARKGCEWVVANDVRAGVFGAADNRVHLVRADGIEDWPKLSKVEVGRQLAARIAEALA